MRLRSRPCFALLIATLACAAAPLAFAQPAAAPAKKDKDKEPAKKPELPKPPPPKPASEITLKVGDKAPAFKPDVWVKPIPAVAPPISAAPAGPPAAAAPASSPSASAPAAGSSPDTLTFAADKVYVIEFWATWCASCREAMPMMAKLARANKDLVVIAVASSERKPLKDAPDQRLEGVRTYAGENAEKMPFAVVFDGTRTIANAWIAAAGRVWIPTAFVVDNTGTVTFIGDPRDKAFDSALTKALKALPQPKPPEPVTPEPKKKTIKPRPKN